MKTIVVLLFLFVFNFINAQENYKIYSWETARKLGKDTVYGISFSKTKFDSIPADLVNFTNLKYLDLSKHKLSNLPLNFTQLIKLEVLNLEKNNFKLFPIQVCALKNLDTLIINRNDFSTFPVQIAQLKNLHYLDVWATPIMSFPPAFDELKSLKKVDARGITHGKNFQEGIRDRMPWVHFIFDLPCNCAD